VEKTHGKRQWVNIFLFRNGKLHIGDPDGINEKLKAATEPEEKERFALVEIDFQRTMFPVQSIKNWFYERRGNEGKVCIQETGVIIDGFFILIGNPNDEKTFVYFLFGMIESLTVEDGVVTFVYEGQTVIFQK
jgi:hypothetical protein